MTDAKSSTSSDPSIDLVFSELQRWINQLRPLGYVGAVLITSPDGDLIKIEDRKDDGVKTYVPPKSFVH